MKSYQLCHLQILVKNHKKIKKICVETKKNSSEVLNDILSSYFSKEKESKESIKLVKKSLKNKEKVFTSKKSK